MTCGEAVFFVMNMADGKEEKRSKSTRLARLSRWGRNLWQLRPRVGPKPAQAAHTFWPKELKRYRGIRSMRRESNWVFLFVRALVRRGITLYHSEIRAIGLENIPPDGSVMLVGNHPNSILDYHNLLQIVPHPMATAAKDTLMSIPIFGKLAIEKFYFVPLARRMDDHLKSMEEIQHSRDANERAFKLAKHYLGNGRIFNVYGEGKSTDSRKLQSIKMGFMTIGLEAEREYGFDLNLRFVPFGYFYSRRNSFRNQVALIFGKPFTIKTLASIPRDVVSWDDEKIKKLTKQIMVSGKKRMQQDIEDHIVSIKEKEWIPLIDKISALYVLSPDKYMGSYGNIKEKYILSKRIAESIQFVARRQRDSDSASDDCELCELENDLDAYYESLEQSGLKDGIIRRNLRKRSIAASVLSSLFHFATAPLTWPAHILFAPVMLLGRYGRNWAIHKKKMDEVDGDEKALLFAVCGYLASLPLQIGLIIWAYWAWFPQYFMGHLLLLIPLFFPLVLTWWSLSLRHFSGFQNAYRFWADIPRYLFQRKRIAELRRKRFAILDRMDKILGDTGL